MHDLRQAKLARHAQAAIAMLIRGQCGVWEARVVSRSHELGAHDICLSIFRGLRNQGQERALDFFHMITLTFDNLLNGDGEPFLLSFLEANVSLLIVLFKLLRLNTGRLFDYSLHDPLILAINSVSLPFLDNVI